MKICEPVKLHLVFALTLQRRNSITKQIDSQFSINIRMLTALPPRQYCARFVLKRRAEAVKYCHIYYVKKAMINVSRTLVDGFFVGALVCFRLSVECESVDYR